jgi:hypothetical protein
MKNFRPLLLFAAFVLVIGLACSAVSGGGDTPTQPQQQPQQQEPVQVVEPTKEPTQAPTEPPAPEPTQPPAPEPTQPPVTTSKFFREEFDSSAALANWNSFSLGSGSDSKLKINQEDDHLLFDLGDKDLYVYYMYGADQYDNVAITLNAENRGRNNNNVSLVCRMNSDETQWYEFSVENGGLWYLYAVDKGYNIIDNGGTNSLKQGKEVNEYKLVCDGSEITMYVNGDEVKTVNESRYGFRDGYVGFNISSLNVLPITVEVNWFEISKP